MNKTVVWIVIVLVIIGGFWLFQSSDDSVNTSDEPIKIGALLVLSGDGASWGEFARDGIQLALDEYNTNAEREIQIIYEDTAGLTERAVSGYKKLVEINEVDALMGPLFTAEVEALLPLIEADGIPVVTPSAAVIERPNPRNPLMVWMDPETEAAQMAEYVFETGARRVSVIGSLDAWETGVSTGFSSHFAELGGEVIFEELVQPDTSDMRTTVTKAIAESPDAVFVGTFFQFIPTTRVLNELQYSGDIYSIEVDSYLANETKDFASGLQFIAPDLYSDIFVTTFEETYGLKPGIPAGQGYDAMQILIEVLTTNNTTEDVLAAMAAFDSYDGAGGQIEFTDDNRKLFPTAIFELQNGEVNRLQ